MPCVILGTVHFSSIRKPTECLMCSDSPVQVTFKPCGHRIACHACAQRMKKCFFCKSVIKHDTPVAYIRTGSNYFFKVILK